MNEHFFDIPDEYEDFCNTCAEMAISENPELNLKKLIKNGKKLIHNYRSIYTAKIRVNIFLIITKLEQNYNGFFFISV